jgi:hypothetical protein
MRLVSLHCLWPAYAASWMKPLEHRDHFPSPLAQLLWPHEVSSVVVEAAEQSSYYVRLLIGLFAVLYFL